MAITDTDIKKLKTIFATKDDLKGFATKDDLKGFATKDDLKGFATKDDLMSMEKRFDLKFATKEDLMKMEKRLTIFVENESAINMEILMKYFERAGIDTHEKRIKALEKELGITAVFN